MRLPLAYLLDEDSELRCSFKLLLVRSLCFIVTGEMGCAASDDLLRAFAKLATNTPNDVPPVPPRNPVSSGQTLVNNDFVKKCKNQAGRSAVVEAWNQINSSGELVSKDYLISVARDAIQKCTVGKLGDEVLDELANLVVSDFEQEHQGVELR